MKIVGVTSCTVGIAHTYMAAEAMEKYFRKLGHQIKIERDGNAGPENMLEEDEIRDADAIILALSGDLHEPERFAAYAKKTIECSAQEALRKTERLKTMLEQQGLYKQPT